MGRHRRPLGNGLDHSKNKSAFLGQRIFIGCKVTVAKVKSMTPNPSGRCLECAMVYLLVIKQIKTIIILICPFRNIIGRRLNRRRFRAMQFLFAGYLANKNNYKTHLSV